jgi:hypothetical protein
MNKPEELWLFFCQVQRKNTIVRPLRLRYHLRQLQIETFNEGIVPYIFFLFIEARIETDHILRISVTTHGKKNYAT